MSSWYSNLLTKTSSQISSLRSTLLASEADGDSEDDTHVCRVLRNHYAEKSRPLPPWLPSDPKAGTSALTPTPSSSSAVYVQSNTRQQPAAGFGSLWDDDNNNNNNNNNSNNNSGNPQRQQPQLQVQTQSLRARPGMFSPVVPQQRAGSQTPVGGSAQDRLRQRLWGAGGARTTSPNAQAGPFQPPPPPSPAERPYMGANAPWSSGDDMGGGGNGRRRGLSNAPKGYR